MNQETFLKRIEELHNECVEIVKIKNKDYSTADDPFRNFKAPTLFGITVEKAILVRMADKISRTSVLLDKKAHVKDESLTDSLQDLANYALILATWLESKNSQVK